MAETYPAYQDISMNEFELMVKTDDFVLTNEDNTVLQDFRTNLYTIRGELFYAPNFGIGIYRYLHRSKDPYTADLLQTDLLAALYKDARIETSSISVWVQDNDFELKAYIRFVVKQSTEASTVTVTVSDDITMSEE